MLEKLCQLVFTFFESGWKSALKGRYSTGNYVIKKIQKSYLIG